MADQDFISVGRPMPRILGVRHVRDKTVEVTWQDGSVQNVDTTPAIVGHRSFLRLRNNDAAFAQVSVSETADSLVWPDGEELSAVWLEELAPASLDNEQFRQAMDELQFSLDGMAARLGVARRLIADYRKDKPIPPAIAMATRYLIQRRREAS